MGFIDQGAGYVPRHTGQADIQPGAEEVGALSQTQIDFGRYRRADRKHDRLSKGRNHDGAAQAGGPGGGKQLLGIGTDARRAGS